MAIVAIVVSALGIFYDRMEKRSTGSIFKGNRSNIGLYFSHLSIVLFILHVGSLVTEAVNG